MMNKMLFNFFSCICLMLYACSQPDDNGGNGGVNEWPAEPKTLADASATLQTQALYRNLYTLAGNGTMFGHQIPTLYGLDNRTKWYAAVGETDRSDTKYLIGDHPAVCGWDLSYIELDHTKNIDGDVFDEVRKHIIAAYGRGAVNTISWHAANPVTYGQLGTVSQAGTSWDKTRAVYSIIPGGSNHELYKGWLDKVAAFLSSLKSADGEAIPVIFRPFHEHTGSGFWWGRGNCTSSEFIALWQFTVGYLRDQKGLHNVIYAYSPDMIHIVSPAADLSDPRDVYMEFWPGDSYVDMLGLDAYDREGSDYAHKGRQIVRLCLAMAREKGMPFAITETGLENNDPVDSQYNSGAQKGYCNQRWWTQMLYKMFEGQRVSFVLLWRNGELPNSGHYFSAFRGCYTEADFRTFASRDDVLFESDLPDLYR